MFVAQNDSDICTEHIISAEDINGNGQFLKAVKDSNIVLNYIFM